MEQQRLFLTIGLFFLLYLAYGEWQLEFGPKPAPTPYTQVQSADTASAESSDVPVGANNSNTSAVPQSSNNSSVPSAESKPVVKQLKHQFLVEKIRELYE